MPNINMTNSADNFRKTTFELYQGSIVNRSDADGKRYTAKYVPVTPGTLAYGGLPIKEVVSGDAGYSVFDLAVIATPAEEITGFLVSSHSDVTVPPAEIGTVFENGTGDLYRFSSNANIVVAVNEGEFSDTTVIGVPLYWNFTAKELSTTSGAGKTAIAVKIINIVDGYVVDTATSPVLKWKAAKVGVITL